MSSKTLREQLAIVPKPDTGKATLNFTLTPPDGSKVRRGVYLLTETQWHDLIKGLEAVRESDL